MTSHNYCHNSQKTGTARFVEHGPNEKHIKLAVLLTDPEQERKGIYKHRDASLPKTLLTAEKVMVACGTRPVRQEGTIFDGKRVFDSDQVRIYVSASFHVFLFYFILFLFNDDVSTLRAGFHCGGLRRLVKSPACRLPVTGFSSLDAAVA